MASPDMSRIIVSSHLDDAALSAFSVVDAETTVVTVLAAFPPSGHVGRWDADGGATDSHRRVGERREEDRRAVARVSANPVHLDLADGQYVTAGLLPEPTVVQVAAPLEPLVRDATEIYAPAGIGNGVHALVRNAVLAIRPDATLYADLPYALKAELGGFSLRTRTRGSGSESMCCWTRRR